MKLNKKCLQRVCAFLSAGLIVAASSVFPVPQAATYDFLDYMTNVRVTDDRNIVTISLPCDISRFDLYPSNMDIKETTFSDYMVYNFQDYESTGISYDLTLSPSWSNKSVNFLSLNNIPNNTEINVWLRIETYTGGRNDLTTALYPYEDYEWDSEGGRIFYYKGADKVRTLSVDFGYYDTPSNTPFHYFLGLGLLYDPLDPTGSDFVSVDRMYPNFYLNGLRFNGDCDMKISVDSYEILLHIDSLVATGQYGKLLDCINDKLVSQGLYIDPKTGDITHIKPGVGEADSLLDQSNDKFKDNYTGFDSYGDAMLGFKEIGVDNFHSGINNLVDPDSFLTVISPFREMWNYQPLSSILLIVVSLIVISLVFFGKRG